MSDPTGSSMMTKRYRRASAFVAVLATIGLAACGGGSNTPRVASLGHRGDGSASTSTTLPKGSATQLLDKWAKCMRSHGDPGQVDPTVDADGVIHITFPPPAAGGGGRGTVKSPGGPDSPCGAYLTAASTALRGGKPLEKPDPAKIEKYAQCMRAHGIADFPDPSGQGLQLRVHPGSDLDPNNPAFKAATKLCAKKTGVPGLGGGGTPPRGAIEATSGSGPGAGPAGNSNQGGFGTVTGGIGG
jgi:hypothetical protein